MNTASVPCKITLPEDTKMLQPGENCKFNIKLDFPLAIKSQSRITIKEGGRTIFAGLIGNVFPDTQEDHKEDKEEKRAMKKKKSTKN